MCQNTGRINMENVFWMQLTMNATSAITEQNVTAI